MLLKMGSFKKTEETTVIQTIHVQVDGHRTRLIPPLVAVYKALALNWKADVASSFKAGRNV